MAFPPQWDWLVWVGNTHARRFRLQQADGSGLSLTGSVIVVTMTWAASSLTLRSDGGSPAVVFADQSSADGVGWFTVTLTPAVTRQLPILGKITFEIERRISGEEVTWLGGRVIADTQGNIDG